MTRFNAGLYCSPCRCVAPAAAAVLMLTLAAPATALETRTSGRVTFGASYRTEAADPALLFSLNAAAAGLTGLAAGGHNADDANTNIRRHEATSRALKGFLEFGAIEGKTSALVRIKAWHDFALNDDPRAWGNSPNGYAAGQPLSDAGAPRLSRFSGVALSDYYVQHSADLGGMRLFARIGQQSLNWGERVGFAGGLQALNPLDFPAIRRAGAVPQEVRVPVPMLFARIEPAAGFGMEGFYQTRFRPSALDMCGTFWSPADYLVDGCDKAFAGAPAASDRARTQTGAYLRRVASPPTDDAQYGAALTWSSAALATDFGLYHARYTNRTPTPGLRKSTRTGPALVPGDPGGQNIAFFTEYVERIGLFALEFAHRRHALTLYGELSYRPNQPLQLPPADVLGAFLSATAPSLLRADANAVAPGGYFHGQDRYAVTQAQFGVQREWKLAGGPTIGAGAELVHKHAAGLPDQAVRRYLRADQFGQGPINGVCTRNSPDPIKQCSLDGYVSSNALAYRFRLEARYGEVMPGLDCQAVAILTHDVKGWSYDGLINEGRKTMTLLLRVEYRKRYLAEIGYAPIWGGKYNHQADRDQVAFSVGVKF